MHGTFFVANLESIQQPQASEHKTVMLTQGAQQETKLWRDYHLHASAKQAHNAGDLCYAVHHEFNLRTERDGLLNHLSKQ